MDRLKRAAPLLRILAFGLIFLLLLHQVSGVLRVKNYQESMAAFYEEPKDSLDVLLMGSSHMHNGVSAVQLWEERGFTVNNFAQNGQVLPVTYYALEEALRYQRPKLIVLDVYKAVEDSKIESPAALHFTLDNMTPWLPKLTAGLTLPERGDRAQYLFHIIRYHTRWKELTPRDFQPPDTVEKGAQTLFTVAGPEAGWALAPETETAPPADVEMEYLEKIVVLCQEKEIPLLLVAVPFTAPAEDELSRQAVMNQVGLWAAERGVPFLNLMYRMDDMDLNLETDLADIYHMNWRGMEKVTAWLGEYLTENYDLPDRRDDQDCEAWRAAAARYDAWLAEKSAEALNREEAS